MTFLEDQCLKLIDIEKQFGVIDTEFDIDKRLNFYFYELMYQWSKNSPFIEVMLNNPGIDEGSIVKMVNSVERLCQ